VKKKFSVSKTDAGNLVIDYDGKGDVLHNSLRSLYSLFKELQPGSDITIEFEIPEAEIWYVNGYMNGASTRSYKTLEEVERARLPGALVTIKISVIGVHVTTEKVWSKSDEKEI